ncbi:DEKNAAC103765 [Brettanomyces naardenensis]|uniref:DEKNAAC103765 n=1 Tax=Brettanomyces naardenensis TaxID=13370 RepID=A0A448YP67_BRENA|nr:DEKNAAC103765 [Brettanomyces naardenensis]
MYDISIDLDKGLKAQFDSNDKNCTRLFWFAERTSDIVERYFVASENMDGSELVKILDQYAKTCVIKVSSPKVVSLGVCKIPDLDLVQGFQDPDWLEGTLEWLTYASIGGTQLFPYDKTDSYISSYSSLFESKSEDNLVKISISGVLIGSEFIVSVIERLIGEAGWFGALVYGVKDCNTSYGVSTRHNFSEDGTNDAVILVSSSEWVLWEVGDSGDSH